MKPEQTALVLSGGGARGAYEAGVVLGLVEALGLSAQDPAPIQMFCGTSVGALNATYLAAHVDRGDLGAEGLAHMWRTRPDIRALLRPDVRGIMGLMGAPGWLGRRGQGPWGPSLLDPRPMAEIIEESVPWGALHDHSRTGRLPLLAVPTLHVGSGQVRIFAQVGAGQRSLRTHNDRLWIDERQITADHILASAAIPLVFPPRRLEGAYHVDGGVRLNTPIAPALRGGARRLVVVSLHPEGGDERTARENEGAYANPLYLAGRLLDALLIDGMEADLHMLSRMNLILGEVDQVLTVKQRAALHAAIAERRGGQSYGPVEILVLRPPYRRGTSAEAGRFLATREARDRLGPAWYRVMKTLARGDLHALSGLASYLLFDKGYTGRLVDLGVETVRQRADEIRAFFNG